ncbi:MAG: DUF222 domain-containing protein [Actinomycetota bacterium]|nr:HNH endonuclease [Actinomycetota bacterium]
MASEPTRTTAADTQDPSGMPPDSDEPPDMPTERLESEIVRFSAHIAAATCRWLLLIAEFDRRGAYGAWDARNTASWLALQCGIDPITAREHVRVARALVKLPLTRSLFSEGRLSYSKVRALTRVGTERNEESLLQVARYGTAAQLERLVRKCKRWLPSESQGEEEFRNRFMRYHEQEDGTVIIVAQLCAEDAAVFKAAIEATKNKLGTRKGDLSVEHAPGFTYEPWSASNADALVALSKMALSNEGVSRSAMDAYCVVVHVDDKDLRGEDKPKPVLRGELDDGKPLADQTVRRICCDARLQAMIHDKSGMTLGIGRTSRTVPRWLRRALHHRDKGCRFPDCSHQMFLLAHHIIHWSDGGPTDLDNLVELCWFHHHLVHEGGYKVEFKAGQAISVTASKPRRRPLDSDEPKGWRLEDELGVSIDDYAGMTECMGDRLDMGYVLDIIARDGPVAA